MDAMNAARYAHALYDAHGDRAEAEAALRERDCAARGQPQEASDWQDVRRAIRALRGPNES